MIVKLFLINNKEYFLNKKNIKLTITINYMSKLEKDLTFKF